MDKTTPTITCPTNLTAVTSRIGDACAAVNFSTPITTDNCPGVTVVCNPPAGACFPQGVTTVTCTAMDTSHKAAVCSFTVSVFGACLQDDSNSSTVLLFNTVTGDYRFCAAGQSFTGRGAIRKRGQVYTLEHNPTYRRVQATLDGSQKKGTASLQSPRGVTLGTITDRNTSNNSCACADNPAAALISRGSIHR